MKQIPKEKNGGLLRMCVKTDQVINYYQDATIGNEKQVDIVISLTLTLADATTKERNYKHPFYFILISKESQVLLSSPGTTRCANIG